MKNQKKFLAAFLSLTTVLGISSCGAERGDKTAATTTTPVTTTNTLDDDIKNMLITVAFETGKDKSWTQLREENEGMINSVLDTYVSE